LEEKAKGGDPVAFMKKGNYTYGLILASEDMTKAYGVTAIPVVCVISQEGLLAWVGHPTDSKLVAAIDHLLARETP
jgi:hypothetical protein